MSTTQKRGQNEGQNHARAARAAATVFYAVLALVCLLGAVGCVSLAIAAHPLWWVAVFSNGMWIMWFASQALDAHYDDNDD